MYIRDYLYELVFPGEVHGLPQTFIPQNGMGGARSELKSALYWCGRRDCPNCYRRWIDDTAQGILERFGVDELYVTIDVREAPDDVDTWKAQRHDVIDENKAAGIAGGAVVQV